MSLRTTLRRLGIYKAVCLGAAVQTALAGGASAATLSSASLSFTIGGLLPAAFFPGIGATGTATSQLSASLGGSGVFNGAFTTTLPTSAAPPLTAVQVIITKNAGVAFTGTAPSKVGGSLAIEGTANIYGIGGFPGGGPPLLAVPLKLGTPSTVVKSGSGVVITAISGAWSAGTVSVITGTNGTVTAAGSNGLTPGGAGTLVLVAPVQVLSGVAGTLAAFGVLTLTYVPEPGTALLLGLGVAGLGALGRRRRRIGARDGSETFEPRPPTAARDDSTWRRAALAVAATTLGALALTAPSGAATLASASLRIQLETLPSGTFPGTGVTGSATSALAASVGAGTSFAGTFTTTTPTSAAPPLSGIQIVVTGNSGGAFAGTTPSKVGGILSIDAQIGLDVGVLLSIPLKLGAPSTLFKSAGGFSVTSIGAAWTAGTAVVALPSPTGSVTAMGANGLTPAGAGTLVLVTPIRIATNVAGPLAAFGTLTLVYVPEPGTLALFALGLTGLAALRTLRR